MPKQIGKYDILRTLGQGAMGEVYLAYHPAIGREVAIKTILPTAAKGEDAEGRFRREAAAAGRLNHPNLVTVYDFDKDNEVFFLVMEYVKGDDLEDLIRQRALSPSQFLEALAQVCDGLAHAHRNGVIHRDVKPANIRVMRDGRSLLAKIMDFGIARVQDSNLTATGIVMGTVNYMAPEYIREGRATAQSDLFAVGVMLYECLAGRKPFSGDNTTTVLFKIVSDAPAPLELEATQGISPAIRGVLDKALAKDPAARFQSAEELAKALRACKDPTFSGALDEATSILVRERLADAAPGAQPPAAPTLAERPAAADRTTRVPAPPAPRRAGRHAAGAAALLLAAGAGWLALRSRTRAPDPVPVATAPVPSAAPAPIVAPAPAPAAAPIPAAPPAPVPAAAPAAPARPKEAPRPPAAVSAAPAPAEAAPPAPAPAEDPLKTIGKLIETDPRKAQAVLRPLVQAQPANVELQGNYLSALYRSRDPQEFDRALARAAASGVTAGKMLSVPAFKAAMIEEIRLQKAKSPSAVLPAEVMTRVSEGL